MPQLTRILLESVRPRYHFKRNWFRYGQKQELPPPEIPRAYVEQGIPLINAAAEQKQHEKFVEDYCEWEPDHPIFIGPPGNTPRNPRWKDQSVRLYDGSNQLLEGIEQMQIITKTVVTRGVPSVWKQLEPLVRPYHLPDEDERMRRYVMQSVRWDPSIDRLPTRALVYTPFRPIYYGITLERSSRLLANNMLRLTEMSFGGKHDLRRRQVIRNALSQVTWARGEDRIAFDCNNDLLISSEKPLHPFATTEEVGKTSNIALPSIFPLKFNISLDEVNVYDWENRHPFTDDCPFGVPHTIFVLHNDTTLVEVDAWTHSQMHAKALGHCYATLAAYAKRLYGENVKELPQPLSVQCVYAFRGRRYFFYAFQLNTLAIDHLDGIKNQLWIDASERVEQKDDEVIREEMPYAMFRLADQMQGLMGYQIYKEKKQEPRYPIRLLDVYHPEVVNKFFVLYANQLHLTDQIASSSESLNATA
ncbi:39S ribosomal protein L37, mitochondrial-like [Paramacrobiotus metropolitanus]|uniref:39S ribosomal protein L37, mitochondrial-like n=1 Tax=Paramacrobiotus metropolitanus TaxID=2943436 RepID=UPI00244579A8|nr:39S ribosomal protein L37, mitochondrial-like [Paramacrobiotus metropolitanus]